MSRLHEFQRQFAALVQDAPSGPVSMALKEENGVPIGRRLDVYRNNVFHSLTKALAQAFPVVERLVGVAFFAAAAREFLRDKMPRQNTLIGFGAGFPEFLETFEPVAGLSYLPDVARLELAWLEAYHAPDAAPAGVRDFARVAPAQMADTRLVLHPSARLLNSAYPIFEIWRTNREDDGVGPVDLGAGSDELLIVRPRLQVEVRQLTPGVAAFLSVCADGGRLESAAGAGVRTAEDFDLTRTLHDLIVGETFAGYRL